MLIAAVFLYFYAIGFSAAKLQAPINLNVTNVTSSSISITYDVTKTTGLSHDVEVVSVNNLNDVRIWTTKKNRMELTGLRSNIAYTIRVRATNGTNIGNYSNVLYARTAPNGAGIIGNIATPTFITVFLEQVPGARSWVVEYSAENDDNVLSLETSFSKGTQSLYIAILTGLTPNTKYVVRARVTRVLNTTYTISQSPFGRYTNISTEKSSMFGRVTFVNKTLLNTDEYKTIVAEQLTAAYSAISAHVSDVSVIEIEDSHTCHYELKVNNRSRRPSTSGLELNDTNIYSNSEIKFNLAGTNAYRWGYAHGSFTIGSIIPSKSHCSDTDTRNLVFHSNSGGTSRITLPAAIDGKAQSLNLIQFNQNEVKANQKRVFEMESNSVYGIRYDYLIKICESSSAQSTKMYDRVYSSTASKEADKYTYIYTTAPGAIKKNDVKIFPINKECTFSTCVVGFNVSRVQRANEYVFRVEHMTLGAIIRMANSAFEIDSSEYVQVTTRPVKLNVNTTYNFVMRVKALLANSTSVSSRESTFSFFTGPPNHVPFYRIIEITDDQLTIEWSRSNYADGYEIYFRNTSTTHTVIVGDTTSVTINNLSFSVYIFNVTMIAKNGFGKSRMNLASQTTRPWRFHNVTGVTFILTWSDPYSSPYTLSTDPQAFISGSGRSAHFSKLTPGVKYTVNVTYNVTSGKKVLFFSAYQLTDIIPPLLTITNVSNGYDIKISWSTVHGAIYYVLMYKRLPEEHFFNETTTRTELIISDVYGNSVYRAIAYTIGADTFSAKKEIVFRTAILPPANLTVSNVTSNSLFVSWKSINGVLKYQIYIFQSTNITRVNTTLNTNNLIENLLPGVEYLISVVAEYPRSTRSNLSSKYEVITAAKNLEDFRVDGVTNSTVSLSWVHQKTAASYRAIALGFGAPASQTSVTSNNATLEGLLAGTQYEVLVYTSSNLGRNLGVTENVHQPPALTIITAPNPPYNISITKPTQKNVNITWLAHTGSVSFVVFIRTTKSDIAQSNYSTISMFLSVSDFPLTTCFIAVRAINAQGYPSNNSKEIEVKPELNISLGWTHTYWWVVLLAVGIVLILSTLIGWTLCCRSQNRLIKKKGEYDLKKFRKRMSDNQNGEQCQNAKMEKSYDPESRENYLGSGVDNLGISNSPPTSIVNSHTNKSQNSENATVGDEIRFSKILHHCSRDEDSVSIKAVNSNNEPFEDEPSPSTLEESAAEKRARELLEYNFQGKAGNYAFVDHVVDKSTIF